MSYIIIKVYNFECDWPDCRTSNIEVSPIFPATVATALEILRETEHWTVKGGKHYCPKHTAEPHIEMALSGRQAAAQAAEARDG